jgi:hypothetical protein
MAKNVLTQQDMVIQTSISTPATGFFGFGSKADGLYQRDAAGTERRLLTTDEGVIKRIISSISEVTTGAALAGVDYVYICTGTFNYTQPTAVGNANRYTLKNAGTGVITIVFTSSQNADGSTTIPLNPGEAREFISNNTNWLII